MVSSWFRLFLYCTLGDGPISLYLPKGSRVPVIPCALRRCKYVLITTVSHEPIIIPADNCIIQLNDILQMHAVFVQVQSYATILFIWIWKLCNILLYYSKWTVSCWFFLFHLCMVWYLWKRVDFCSLRVSIVALKYPFRNTAPWLMTLRL